MDPDKLQQLIKASEKASKQRFFTVSYPLGRSIESDGTTKDNADFANEMLLALEAGISVAYPDHFSVKKYKKWWTHDFNCFVTFPIKYTHVVDANGLRWNDIERCNIHTGLILRRDESNELVFEAAAAPLLLKKD